MLQQTQNLNLIIVFVKTRSLQERWKLIQGIQRKIWDSGNNCGDKISMTSKRKQ